jgi:hypothetical protein
MQYPLRQPKGGVRLIRLCGFERAALTVLLVACERRGTEFPSAASVPMMLWSSSVDTLPGTYTALGNATEFWDSVLVTTDASEKLVWRVDVRTGTRSALGSRGDGPGEFSSPGKAVQVSRDTFALLYLQQPTFPVLSVATGRGRTQFLGSYDRGITASTGSRSFGRPFLRYADTLGNIYGAPMFAPLQVDAKTGRRDLGTIRTLTSIPIVRYSMRTGREDTIIRLPRGVEEPPSSRDASGVRSSAMELGRYGAYNGWLATANGLLIVANAATYTLTLRDLFNTRGALTEIRVPHANIPVSNERWKAYVQFATTGVSAEIEKLNTRVWARIGKAPPTIRPTRYVIPDMPRALPAITFDNGRRQMHESDGVVWVPVHVDDAWKKEYWDLIDLTKGTRLTTLALPENQYLLTVTSNGAYVLISDVDDLQRVILYRHSANKQ